LQKISVLPSVSWQAKEKRRISLNKLRLELSITQEPRLRKSACELSPCVQGNLDLLADEYMHSCLFATPSMTGTCIIYLQMHQSYWHRTHEWKLDMLPRPHMPCGGWCGV